MKTFISIILFTLLGFNFGFSQQLNWVKEHPLNDNGYHFGNTVSTDKNNNIYCSSIYNSYPQPGTGSYIRKYNKLGGFVWERFLLSVLIGGLATDENGNSYITGTFGISRDFDCGVMHDTTQRQMFLTKLDSNGNCLWSKEVKNAYGSKIAIDKSGNAIYVTGGNNFYGPQFGCPSPVHQRFHFVAKYDNDGNCLWLNPILTSQYLSGIAVNDKYVAVTGRFDQVAYFGMDSAFSIGQPYAPPLPYSINNIYTALYDLQGNLKWAKVTGDSSDVYSNSIAIDDSNNVYVAGNYSDEVYLADRYFHVLQWQDIFLVKYNEQGDTVLTTTWPGDNSEKGRAIYVNKNGVYFSGGCYSEVTIADTTINPGTSTIVLAKLSFDLKHVEWLKTFSSPGNVDTEILQITADSQNNIIACGDYTGSLQVDSVLLSYNNSYYKKPFILSIEELSPIVLSVPEKVVEQSVFKVYPNPTLGVFQISFNSSGTNSAVINIIDANGQTVYHKVFQQIQPNFIKTDLNVLTTSIDLRKEAKGIYFIEIIADDKKSIKKIVLD
jgi:hypothetical protein